MLLSGNFQYEYVASEKRVQTTILLEHVQFKPLRPVLFSGIFLSENVAEG